MEYDKYMELGKKIQEANYRFQNYVPSSLSDTSLENLGYLSMVIQLLYEECNSNNTPHMGTNYDHILSEYFKTVYKNDYCLALQTNDQKIGFNRHDIISRVRATSYHFSSPKNKSQKILRDFFDGKKSIIIIFFIGYSVHTQVAQIKVEIILIKGIQN